MFSLEVTGDLSSFIGALPASIDKAVSTALDQSAAAILNRLRTTFLAETDPSGTPWIPSHAGQRRRAKGGTGTLFNTGTLFRSIQLSSPQQNVRVISTDVGYALKHQRGLEGMVARPFMVLTDEHKALATSIFESQLRLALERISP